MHSRCDCSSDCCKRDAHHGWELDLSSILQCAGGAAALVVALRALQVSEKAVQVGESAAKVGEKALNTEAPQLREKVPRASKVLDAVMPLRSDNRIKIPADSVEYDALAAYLFQLRASLALELGESTARVLYCEPDGTVIFDSSKGSNNTFANFDSKSINENHNTRVAIMSAQSFVSGYGAEVKSSTSTGRVEVYAGTIVGGSQFNNRGTIRVSYAE